MTKRSTEHSVVIGCYQTLSPLKKLNKLIIVELAVNKIDIRKIKIKFVSIPLNEAKNPNVLVLGFQK